MCLVEWRPFCFLDARTRNVSKQNGYAIKKSIFYRNVAIYLRYPAPKRKLNKKKKGRDGIKKMEEKQGTTISKTRGLITISGRIKKI